MAIMRVAEVNGHALVYDAAEAEIPYLSTAYESVDDTPDGARFVHRSLTGSSELILHVHFGTGTVGAVWINASITDQDAMAAAMRAIRDRRSM